MIAVIIFLSFGSVISQDLLNYSNVCSLPREPGVCKAFFTAFYYNSELGVCDCFIYGGCGSNGNKFDSLEECISTCGNHKEPPIITDNCRKLFSHLHGTIATTRQPPPVIYENEFNENTLDQLHSISNKFSFDVDSGIFDTYDYPALSNSRPPPEVSNTRPATMNSRPSLAALLQRRQQQVLEETIRLQREFERFHQKKNAEELMRQQNVLQRQTDSLRGSG